MTKPQATNDDFQTALEQIRDAAPPEGGLMRGVDTWSAFAERLQKIAADALLLGKARGEVKP